MQRILVIRFSSIGDIVLTSPVVRALRKRFPEADIRFVTKPQFAELVEHNPYINGVYYLNDSLNELAKELKKFGPDLVVDLHHNLRTRILRTLIGGEWRSFHKLNVEKWLKVNFNVDRLPKTHIVDRYIETVKEFGVENDGQGLDFFFPSDFQAPEISEDLKPGFVAVVVGAKFKTKQLPRHKLMEVCNGISKPILLIGGPEDSTLGESISGNSQGVVVNGCGRFSLLESAWLLKQAELVVTHDTGMMHIAAAFNKKIISVWGNTIPEFGMYPYLPEGGYSFISEVKKLDCRPCSKIGYDKCPKGHFNCMEQQDISTVIQQTIKFSES
ncbi:MAG: glycosyltransferase family 9 protein [Flavobacteriales bacterium]|nr:glycosyltransferase family 9 protein [Flavobacteriales bacterium]MCB9205321.1 glycosyltransferase family 9 protein [Flavobacteriales bacterium]